MMNVEEYLEATGMTQKALAKLVKCSPSLISHIVTGRRRVSAEVAMRLQKVTKGRVSSAELRPDLWGG